VQPLFYTSSHLNVDTGRKLCPLYQVGLDLRTALCWTSRGEEHLQASEQQC